MLSERRRELSVAVGRRGGGRHRRGEGVSVAMLTGKVMRNSGSTTIMPHSSEMACVEMCGGSVSCFDMTNSV